MRDGYFLGIAQAVSAGAECIRRQVGAVLVRDGRVVSCGANAMPPGQPGCLDGLCPRGQKSYGEIAARSAYEGPGQCFALHAEEAAIIGAGYEQCRGAVLYVTCEPCPGCYRVINAIGIARVVFPQA